MDALSGDKVTDAAALVVDGTDTRAIQVLLGHRRIDTTARYVAVTPQSIGRIVSPLDHTAGPTAVRKRARKTITEAAD